MAVAFIFLSLIFENEISEVMATFLNRFLSLVVVFAYVATVYAETESAEKTFRVCIGLILPLVCIWFGEQMGAYTGSMRGHYISTQTPGCLVAAGGWMLLLGAPIIGYFLSKGL